MNFHSTTQVETVNRFLKLVESLNDDAAAFERILSSDYSQTEYPNAMNKAGQTSDRADSIRRMALGRRILTEQRYDVKQIVEQGTTVIVESIWTGRMAVEVGALKKDQVLKAFFCMVFEFVPAGSNESGKIRRVRNYDCFESFA